MPKVEQIYSDQKLKALERKVIREVDKLFNQLIKELSTTIEPQINKSTTINLLLKKQLQAMKKDFSTKFNNEILSLIDNATNLAYEKNKIFVNDYIKDITIPKALKEFYLKKATVTVNLRKISSRVWKLSENYFSMVELTLNSGLYEGLPAIEIAKDLRKLLNNPNALNINELRRIGIEKVGGLKKYRELEKKILNYKPGRGIYKSAKKNAYRLARTEINRAYLMQDHQQRKKLNFVVGQEVHLSASHPITDMCDDLQGKYPKQFVFSGWHPQCLCYSTSITLTKEEFKEYLKSGEVKKQQVKGIPDTAKSWIEKNKKVLSKDKTYYWIDDNFKKTDLSLLKQSNGV